MVTVVVKIADGPTDYSEYTITINISEFQKKQIRGMTVNDGYWSNLASSSLVQTWTDYIYSLTPSASTTRFASGTWKATGSVTRYVVYANNTDVKIEIPTNLQVKSLSLIGYGGATFGLSSEGATVEAIGSNAFATDGTANTLSEVKFELTNHVVGTPLTVSVNDVYCRFYIVFTYEELADVTAPTLTAQKH